MGYDNDWGKRFDPQTGRLEKNAPSSCTVDSLVGLSGFRTIVADPPWRPILHANNPRRATADLAGPQKHYPTMLLGDILSMNVPSAKQCHLYLWVVTQHVEWGCRVARAWGFKEVVTMLTWCKPGTGCGRFMCNTEHVLVCRKGTRSGNPFGLGGQFAPATIGTWFNWPRGRHSEKPAAFFDIVERISPGPYLEMFARRPREGWTVWGNEVEANISIREIEEQSNATHGGTRYEQG